MAGQASAEIEITPEMERKAVAFLMDYFCCEWGSKTQISEGEARAVARGVLLAVAPAE